MLGRLPMEMLRLILNGGPSTRLRMRHPKEKGSGTYLDRRWRFAARATCHLWRAIIEHPTLSEVNSIGWREFCLCPTRCPKLTTGRIVCASAVADWIGWTVSAWSPHTADQIYGWCRYMAPTVSRKLVIVALVASMVPGAIEHAIRVEWERVLFTVDDELVADGRMCGEHDYWDDDVHGDAWGLYRVLAGVIGERARTLTSCRLFRQCCDNGDVYLNMSYLLYRACQAGNETLVRLLLEDDPLLSVDDYHWEEAAGAPNPGAFIHLLYQHRRKRLRVANPLLSKACHKSLLGNAIDKGRWETLAACDRYGIVFDDSAAFARAALLRHVRLMAWLWERAKRLGRHQEMGLFKAAVNAMTMRGACPSHKSIKWLCTVAEYVPHVSAPGRTINDLVGALDRICTRSLLYGLSRWPRLICGSIDTLVLERAFVACARESLERAHAFLALLDHRANDHGLAPGPGGFDGWAILTRPRHLSKSGSRDLGGNTLKMGQVLAFIRIARRAAHGCHPLRRDVAKLREDADETYPRVCSCNTDPQWSHDSHPREVDLPFATVSVYGIDDGPMILKTQVSTKEAAKRVRKETEARVCPPTESVKQLTYLVGKWCVPHPVRLKALFPGWMRPRRQDGYRDRGSNGRRQCQVERDEAIEIANWLECVGLLLSDSPSTP